MKNVIKKIAAAAMAFTLLGSGTAVIKNAAPKFDNSITASAASGYTYVYDGYVSRYAGRPMYAEYYQGRPTGRYTSNPWG